MVLDQRLPLENVFKQSSSPSQVLDLLSSHKAQSNRAQSYSLHKLRMEVWSTRQRLGCIRWRGYPFREFGDASVLQEQMQLLGFKQSNCLGAAEMCHRRVLLAGGCSELCRTALAVEIASTGAGLANSRDAED